MLPPISPCSLPLTDCWQTGQSSVKQRENMSDSDTSWSSYLFYTSRKKIIEIIWRYFILFLFNFMSLVDIDPLLHFRSAANTKKTSLSDFDIKVSLKSQVSFSHIPPAYTFYSCIFELEILFKLFCRNRSELRAGQFLFSPQPCLCKVCRLWFCGTWAYLEKMLS